MTVDHKEAAEERLAWLNPPDAATAAIVALAHATLALVERFDVITDVLDDLSCLVAVPSVIPDDEGDDD